MNHVRMQSKLAKQFAIPIWVASKSLENELWLLRQQLYFFHVDLAVVCMFKKNNIYGLYGNELFFFACSTSCPSTYGRQPWPLRWWIYNRLRGKGTAVGRFGRFVFGAFLFDAKKIGRLLCGGYLSSTFACARLSFCFVQLILWSGWDASITQKLRGRMKDRRILPRDLQCWNVIHEVGSWWNYDCNHNNMYFTQSKKSSSFPCDSRAKIHVGGTNDHTDLPCFCQRSGELSMGKKTSKGIKKRQSNYSLQNQFECLRTDGCFLKWWYPQNTPKWSFLVGKPMVVGYHHFRKPPDGVVRWIRLFEYLMMKDVKSSWITLAATGFHFWNTGDRIYLVQIFLDVKTPVYFAVLQ